MGVAAGDGKTVRRGLLAADWVMIAAVLFLVFITLGMVFYPGTSNWTNKTTHYSFTQNFLSDLGATRTFANRPNVASNVFFILALMLVGTAIPVFGLGFRALARLEGRMKKVATVALAAGVLSGVCFLGVAATPENVSGNLHELLVQLAFTFLLVLVVMATVAQFAWGRSAIYRTANVAYLVLLGAYLLLLFFGPDVSTLGGLAVQATGQKVIVYASIVNVAFQGLGLRSSFKKIAAEGTDPVPELLEQA